jgi:phosphomevalonate kinase
MIILGIAGKKQSGKDTFADYIIQNARGIVVKRSFSDELKNEVAHLLNISRQGIDQEKAYFRPFLQWYGTEWRRAKFGNDYWIKKLEEKVLLSDADIIIIPDVRFANEVDWVRHMGGTVIKIERLGAVNNDPHVSENQINSFVPDITIKANSGDLKTLKLKAIWLIDQIQEPK